MFREPDALLTDAPVLLGTDGTKMSKSKGNTIDLRCTEDETARLIRRAKTDTDRTITYDPAHRPEVASLLLTAALCTDIDPVDLADSIGNRGAGVLKTVVVEAVNEYFRPLRKRRIELSADPGLLHAALTRGNARANKIANDTLDQVRQVMNMTYSCLCHPCLPTLICHHAAGRYSAESHE